MLVRKAIVLTAKPFRTSILIWVFIWEMVQGITLANGIGVRNTFIGHQAGYNNDADNNTFSGYRCGTNNSSGL